MTDSQLLDDSLAVIQQQRISTEELSERTPLTRPRNAPSIYNPLQEKAFVKRQKQVYSAVTLADVLLKVVHTVILVTFLMFCYTYLNIPDKGSLAAFFAFSLFSGLFLCVMNLFTDTRCCSKQHAIVIGFLIYLIGLALLSAVSVYLPKKPIPYHYICVVPFMLIIVGDGVCKSYLGDFTHTQFASEKISVKHNSYLTRVFWISHVGAFLLIILLLGMIEYMRFDVGYSLLCICALAGLVSFTSSWSRYEETQENKASVLSLVKSVLIEANRKRKEYPVPSQFEQFSGTGGFAHHWLDYAKHSLGGSTPDEAVEKIKSLFGMSMLYFTFIPYWVCNAQSYSTFIFQGFHLNRKLGGVHIPMTWIALLHVAAVLIVANLLDNVIYPCLRRRGATFKTSWRIITGFVFGMLSMMSAAGVEYASHEYHVAHNASTHLVGTVNVEYVEDVHVLWLIPQFVFLGVSEVLVGLAGLGMGYKLCKGTLQKGITTVYYFTTALGHLISLVIVLSGWFPSKHVLDNSRMVVYFMCLGCSSLVSLVLFICVTNRLNFTLHFNASSSTAYRSNSRSEDTIM